MSVSNNEIQVVWSSSDSVSVSAGGNETSDAFAFSAGAVGGVITLKAEHSGTPASGDTVDFYLLGSAGDPDGSGTGTAGSEYPNDETDGDFLARLDTYAAPSGIAVVTVPCEICAVGKLYAKSNAASAVTISACINEKVAS